MKKIYTIICAVCLLGTVSAFSQIVTVSPAFPTQSEVITLTYDATQGNAALAGVTPIYAHIGYNDWNGAPTWKDNAAKYKLTDIGNNKHTLTLTINDYFSITSSTEVTQLAVVFRNSTGTKVGKTATEGDIFIPIFASGTYSARISNPSASELYAMNETVSVIAGASTSSTISIYVNNNIVATDNNVTALTYNLKLTAAGNTELKMIATNGDTTITESKILTVKGTVQSANPTESVVDGINYIDDNTVVLQLYAPGKTFIYAVGDFSNWEYNADYMMKKRADDSNRWWVKISDCTPGELVRFQYWIGDEMARFADPYTELALDPWNDPWINYSYEVYPNLPEYPAQTTGYVATFQTAQQDYEWKYTDDFQKPAYQHLLVYELLIRDFVKEHSYDQVIAKLDYLQNLGVQAIELMPVMEFDGNESWGYSTCFFFAVDKYYGTREALKLFVDEAHKRGMAVVLDIVLNHSTGSNPMVGMYWDAANNRPTSDNPWFFTAGQHPFNVFEDFDHDRPLVQTFMKRVVKYWLEEYNVDGYRFDLAKGFTNAGDAWYSYDQDRVNILKSYADAMREVDPDAYVILEFFADNSEEKVMSDYHAMPWGNLNNAFSQASMGYPTEQDLSWLDYKNRGWFNASLVGYAESHDEERIMFKNLSYGATNGGYNIKDTTTALKRIELMMHFLIPLAGPKMIWQFGELGYDVGSDVNGETGNKPIKWEYLDDPDRLHLYQVTAALAKLKRDENAFRGYDYTYNATGQGKILKINHSDYNVVIVGNFTTSSMNITPGFQGNGTWYEYWTGEQINVTDAAGHQISLAPGGYKLYTSKQLDAPDLSTSFVKPVAAFTSDKTIVCAGESVTFTDNSSNSPTTWVWTIGNGDILTEQNPVYKFTQAGTYNVNLTAANTFGVHVSTAVVTVSEAPVLSAGDDVSICSGSSAALNAVSSSATLAWSSGQTTAAITVSPVVTTTFTVTAGSGACAVTDQVTVTVTAFPDVNAGDDLNICAGEQANITASGATAYSWSNGSTTAAIAVTPLSTATYTVTAGSSSCTATDQVVVNVTPMPVADAGGDVTICTGSDIDLAVSGGVTYQWSNGSTDAIVNVSPALTSTYTVTVTNGQCSDVDEVVVTIGSSLTPGISGTKNICLGKSTTLTANGGSTYTWNTGSLLASLSVSPVATTTYTVTASNQGCTGTNAVVVTVNALPVADAGVDQSVCAGATALLTATGGVTYTWSNGGTGNSVSVATANNYTVTVTDGNGCTDQDETMVTFIAVVANAGDDQAVCSGELVSITATGGVSYVWNTGETTASITATSIATFTVTVSDDNGCAAVDDITITSSGTKPVASFASVIDGFSVAFNSTSVGATSYHWDFGDGQTSTTEDPAHTYASGGNYAITLVAENNCGSDTAQADISGLSYNDLVIAQSKVRIYPNPAAGQFTITSNFDKLDRVQVTDAAGRVMLEHSQVMDATTFDVTSFSPGLYFVKMRAGVKVVTMKLVVSVF